MEFTARVTRSDFIHFQKYATGRINNLPAIKRKITMFSAIYWLLLAAVVVTLLQQYENVNGVERTRLLVASAIFAAWIAVSAAWQRYYLSWFCKEGVDEVGSITGNWRFSANKDGLKEEKDCCSSFFRWECFKSVEEDQYNLYLFTDRMKAVIIPKSEVDEPIIRNLKEYAINRRQ